MLISIERKCEFCNRKRFLHTYPEKLIFALIKADVERVKRENLEKYFSVAYIFVSMDCYLLISLIYDKCIKK